MDAPAACAVRARMACLPEAIAFVEATCVERGVAHGDGLRLSLLVEELFTNTVTHGHGGDCDATVRLVLRVDPTHLELGYEDSAPPFDPVAPAARLPVDPAVDVADRPVGGLGLVLVNSLPERVDYVREDGCNRLRLTLRRQTP